MKTTYELASEIIDSYDSLSQVEITTGINGYPSHLHAGIIGFESFQQAKEVANKYGGEVVSLHRRDGWELWQSQSPAWEAYDIERIYQEQEGCQIYDSGMTEEQFIEEESVADMVADMDSIDAIAKYVAHIKELWQQIETLDDSQFLAVGNGWTEMHDKTGMSYYDDTHHYAIGVELHPQEEEDDDEED